MVYDDKNNTAKTICENWDKALSENNIEKLISLYAVNAILESPLVPHLMDRESGILKGKEEIQALIEIVVRRKPPIRKYFKQNFFTDGKTIIFEYPRQTPEGEQMDFVEIMEIKNGLIHYHRVYWGWRGFKVLKDNLY